MILGQLVLSKTFFINDSIVLSYGVIIMCIRYPQRLPSRHSKDLQMRVVKPKQEQKIG